MAAAASNVRDEVSPPALTLRSFKPPLYQYMYVSESDVSNHALDTETGFEIWCEKIQCGTGVVIKNITSMTADFPPDKGEVRAAENTSPRSTARGARSEEPPECRPEEKNAF
jgi:hypothetical protein